MLTASYFGNYRKSRCWIYFYSTTTEKPRVAHREHETESETFDLQHDVISDRLRHRLDRYASQANGLPSCSVPFVSEAETSDRHMGTTPGCEAKSRTLSIGWCHDNAP